MKSFKKIVILLIILIVGFIVFQYLYLSKNGEVNTSILVNTSQRESREIAHTLYFVEGKPYWLSFTNENHKIGDCFEIRYVKKFPSISKVVDKNPNSFSKNKVIFWGKHYPKNLTMFVKQKNKTIAKQKINGFFAVKLKLSGLYSFSFVKSNGTIINNYNIDFNNLNDSSFKSIELEYSNKRKNVEIGIKDGELVRLN